MRTTADARAPDSSQLLGYCELEIGCESVWPSTTIGCCVLGAQHVAELAEQAQCAGGLSSGLAGIEEDVVGQQLDDEPALADRGLDLAGQALLRDQRVDPAP